jgi:hypothetical protein
VFRDQFGDALRVLINEGGAFTSVVNGALLNLGLWGAISFGLALALFRWR